MEFECSKNALLKSLNIISNVVNDRQTIPILSNVLLETQGQNKVILSATDLKVSVESQLDSQVITAGSMTVPAKRFVQIIKELPDAPVKFSKHAQNHVLIECLQSQFKIIGLPKEEFPHISFFEDNAFQILQKDLKDAIKKVIISISPDTTRHILNGVYFQFSQGEIVLVATDGRRLSHVRLAVDIQMDGDKSVIIPGKMSLELLRTLGEDEHVNVGVGDKEIVFDFGHVRYMSQLIDGKYPNFEQVIPKEVKHQIQLNREQFIGAIRRSAVLVDQKLNRIKLELLENKCVLTTKTPELGESEEILDVPYQGESITVGFAPNYLLDGLKVIDADEVTIGLTDGGKAGIIKADEQFLYVIMPMRLM